MRAPRPGRARSTSHAEIGQVALALFIERGFDETTIDDIARVLGVGRRTIFRYFASKSDLPWGDFDHLLESMRATLAAGDGSMPLMEELRAAIIDFNRVPEHEWANHRRRMELLFRVPSLLAHSTLRFESWRAVIAEHAAHRLGLSERDLVCQTIARTCLAVCLAAYDQWLDAGEGDLLALLEHALGLVEFRV